MLQSNVQTIQDSVPSDLVKQTVRTIITTFLSRLSGTPVHKVEAALGPDRKMLPELALMDFLWSGDGAYFPAFCALYLLGEPAWSEQERHVHSFLEFARDLYAERGVGPHRLGDICTELANGEVGAIQPISLIVGAHFSRSFGTYYHSFQGCPYVDQTHVEPGTAIEVPELQFHLAPKILDYKDLDTSWEEQIKPRLVMARTASVAAPAVATKGSENGSDQGRDVFMCHASEDKEYCEPLTEALQDAGIRVWLDKTALQWGDDLRASIDRGLRNCRYGIVIFSKAFLRKKKWTEYELNSLFALEQVGEKRILPIWHGITREDLLEYSPGLADRLAKVSSSDSHENIVNSLCEMLGRSAPHAPHEVGAASEVNGETVAAPFEPADHLHELFPATPLTATEELSASAEPESKPDGFLIGSRNAWVVFLEQCWPVIGSRILSIAQQPASTMDDVRGAFLPAKEHPHDSGLATHFYRERTQQATPADVVNTGIHLDQVAAEVRQATADRDQAARSCTEAEAALGLATNPKDKEHVQRVVEQRREDLAQLDAKLADLQRTQKQLDDTLWDQQAYVSRSEMLDFLLSAEHSVDPRHIANAVAALPRKTWRESVTLCSQIPFESYVQREYQVFLVISAILNDHSSGFNGGAVEAFRRALLKLSPGSPGQQFFWDNWGDLRSVIEGSGDSGPADSFNLTRMFLKSAMRQKNPLEQVMAESERLRA